MRLPIRALFFLAACSGSTARAPSPRQEVATPTPPPVSAALVDAAPVEPDLPSPEPPHPRARGVAPAPDAKTCEAAAAHAVLAEGLAERDVPATAIELRRQLFVSECRKRHFDDVKIACLAASTNRSQVYACVPEWAPHGGTITGTGAPPP